MAFSFYEIYRSASPEGPFVVVGSSVTLEFTDTTAAVGITYYYYVVSVDEYGIRSSPSEIIEGTRLTGPFGTGCSNLFFDAMAFNMMPTDLYDTYGMIRMHQENNPFATEYDNGGNPNFSIDNTKFNDAINRAIDAGVEYFFWDIESLRIDKDSYSNSVIDGTLDALLNLYNLTKAALPGCQVGYYGIDVCLGVGWGDIKAYWPGGSSPNQSLVETYYYPKYIRLNQRWNGSSYDTVPLSDSMDFFAPEIYAQTTNVNDQINYVVAKIDLFKNKAGGVPVYPFMTMTYTEQAYFGKPISSEIMVATIEACQYNGASGIVMWGGWRASSVFEYKVFTPTSNPLSGFQAINAGSFLLRANGLWLYITGMNFTGAANMDDVAAIIESAVNAEYATLPVVANVIPSSFPSESTPFNVGDFHCTWHSGTSSFHLGDDCGINDNPPGVVVPPDQRVWRSRVYIYSTSLFGFPIIGDDISGSNLIGVDNDGYIPFDANVDEWLDGWAVGLDWWDIWSSAALVQKNTPTDVQASNEAGAIFLTWT